MLQESEKKEMREIAFGALEEAAMRHASKGELLLMGDLNTKLGGPTNTQERKLIGSFGENGRRSDNGRLVLDMMKQIGLVRRANTLPAGDVGFWYIDKFDGPTRETIR